MSGAKASVPIELVNEIIDLGKQLEKIRERTPNPNPWIQNHGYRPHTLHYKTIIDVKLRDGGTSNRRTAGNLKWKKTGLLDDIVEWRLSL